MPRLCVYCQPRRNSPLTKFVIFASSFSSTAMTLNVRGSLRSALSWTHSSPFQELLLPVLDEGRWADNERPADPGLLITIHRLSTNT